MVNRPRIKGTKAETEVARWFVGQGESQVERKALHGAYDEGDLTGLPGCVLSIKFVGQGRPMALSGWLNDLETMKDNVQRGVGRPPDLLRPTGLVIVRRPQYPDPGDWYAVQRLADWWDCYRELLT